MGLKDNNSSGFGEIVELFDNHQRFCSVGRLWQELVGHEKGDI
jgi:hypothetical protein